MDFVVELYPGVADTLSSWISHAKDSNTELRLYTAVDTGATNTRVSIGNDKEDILVAKFQADSTRQLVRCLGELGQLLSEVIPNIKDVVKGGCIAAAGRILDNGSRAEITNYLEGAENQNLLRSELPAELFPQNATLIINDLESCCYGISALNKFGTLSSFFKKLLPTASASSEPFQIGGRHYLVIAIGTGLGVGLLMSLDKNDGENLTVLPLEGGHILLSPSAPSDQNHAEEEELLAFASNLLYKSQYTIEYEDLVSGRGLELLHQFVCRKDEEAPQRCIDAAQIVRKATSEPPCDKAVKALELHYKYLARATQNLAVVLQAKGVFWAGDNQVRNGAFVDKIAADLEKELLSHPKFSWINEMPVFSQIKNFNINIAGALFIAKRQASLVQ
eukprot:TRINITY_DN2609_c0_g2_i2.p1 TRINITY_DN2609_c0_g2~~TRINITY_DN2609_c0_g2_i2.p1  ORF type:complete len:391 (-),score=152.65 TRINITY_DN2609_c0_g2_i2:49-1221(-)